MYIANNIGKSLHQGGPIRIAPGVGVEKKKEKFYVSTKNQRRPIPDAPKEFTRPEAKYDNKSPMDRAHDYINGVPLRNADRVIRLHNATDQVNDYGRPLHRR